MARGLRKFICVAFGLLLFQANLAHAEGLGVVAIVNDQAITELDVSQRISLLKTLGDAPPGGLSRKAALQSLVDDVVKISEAKRVQMAGSDSDIAKQIERLSANMKLTPETLEAKLREQGIGAASFRKYISAQIGFNRIISAKHRADIKVKPTDVDAKLAEIQQTVEGRMNQIKNDPRMKAVTVYTLMEISLPIEQADDQLLQARAIEAAQVARQFKGCKNARAAASGVFNVKFSKPIEADGARLPKPMKAALDKAGPGKAIGPMRSKEGIQLLALCGTRRIEPELPKFEMPTRQQAENMLVNDKYNGFEEAYLRTARKSVYVEYRTPGLSQ